MITKHKQFTVSSEILYLPANIADHDTIEDAQRAEQIVLFAEWINENTDKDLTSDQCITLAEAILVKFDKIDFKIR